MAGDWCRVGLPHGSNIEGYYSDSPPLRIQVAKLRQDLAQLTPTKIYPETSSRSWRLFFTLMNSWPIISFFLVCLGLAVMWSPFHFEYKLRRQIYPVMVEVSVVAVGIIYAACITTWLEIREFVILYANDKAPTECDILLLQYESDYLSPNDTAAWPDSYLKMFEFNLGVRYAITAKILKKLSNNEYKETGAKAAEKSTALISEADFRRTLVTQQLRDLLGPQMSTVITQEEKDSLKFKDVWPANPRAWPFAAFLMMDSVMMAGYSLANMLYFWMIVLCIPLLIVLVFWGNEWDECPLLLLCYFDLVIALRWNSFWVHIFSVCWMDSTRIWILKQFCRWEQTSAD